MISLNLKSNNHQTLKWEYDQDLVPYNIAISTMEKHVKNIYKQESSEIIWLLEHPSIYTCGTSTKKEQILRHTEIPIINSGRGGQVTYHGPGQRIIYVMINLNHRDKDIRKYVKTLENWMIKSLEHIGLKAYTCNDRIGIWVDGPNGESKIGAIGIRVSHWITYHGISINIDAGYSHFKAIRLQKKIKHIKMDIRNLKMLKKTFKKYQPDYVFHLAAQALVKKSYSSPTYTWTTNTIGTLNVLESLRELKKKCIAVIITSDKSYKNLEIKRGYKEDDILGGKDPYSASKASAELAIQSHVNSFFSLKKTKVLIGVGRAGNVIGGGDWSENRLIPDCVKSWSKNKKVLLRNPNSTRPWQHVLEAVGGYLKLAQNLKKNKKLHGEVFNFGPNHIRNYKVLFVVKLMKKYWDKVSWKVTKKNKKNFYESKLLKLNVNKAKVKLKWKSVLTFKETINMVTEWYKKYYLNPKKIYNTSFNQIKEYEKLLIKRSIK